MINNILNNEDENLPFKIYNDPTILTNIYLEKYFDKEDIEFSILNNKVLKITDKGLYSITKFYDAQWITNHIISFLKNQNIIKTDMNNIITTNINIIDGTAGIGGNTINFSKHFSKVFSIEINDIHFNVLKNNIEALNLNNIKLYSGNFLNLIDDLKNESNIFFFDPPWGGNCYKNYKYFNLKIGKLDIDQVINILFDKNIKYIFLKAPHNLNLSSLFSNIKYENLIVHKNLKQNMILIILY
jgi:16S rRNA G966 N2-methylase RsmD